MLPYSLVLRISGNLGSATLLVSFLIGLSLVIGWLSYYTIYPVWKSILTSRPLVGFRLYPIASPLYSEMKKSLESAKLAFTPEHAWSYFLWNHADESIRTRVKSLADYGHSLYLVSLAFIVMPIIYSALRLTSGPYSMLSWLTSAFFSGNAATTSLGETILVLLSLLLGAYLLKQGKSRAAYAVDLQVMLFQENRSKVDEVINSLSRK